MCPISIVKVNIDENINMTFGKVNPSTQEN